MNYTVSFDIWFSSYLGQKRDQVQRLLNDSLASRFLIGWSLFESKCFEDFVKINKLSNFSHMVVEDNSFKRKDIERAGKHFHNRYQNKELLRHLLHKQEVPELTNILNKSFNDIDDSQLVFLLLIIVYRYRNNIFHGNKGVDSWLKYQEQIGLCLDVMQRLIEISEICRNSYQSVA